MQLHANARLTPFQRALLCERVREEGWTVADAAEAAGCSERSAYRWLARHDAGESMLDRSSAPRCRPARTPASVEAEIERLRRLRFTSTRIAATLGLPVSTVCAVLARIGLNRLSKLGPPEPPNRYCRRHAGDLIHLDVKKLGRFRQPGKRVLGQGPGRRSNGAGWEAVNVCVDDATRLAYVEVLPNELAVTTVGFLERAIAWFAERGVTVREVITDNGSPYRSRAWAAFCAARGIEHIRTRPYRPRTNGKAERFIQTMLREWAYAATYRNSHHRTQALRPWLRYYNEQRPHGALGHKTPASRLLAD
ncbi:MAG TPA: IS481 family transposase [Acidimicrobiales bacterium]|nr:IS481 family transposase [Acidimicrobiales bacterium]